jgi:hypothetical protein
VRFLEIWASNK